MEARADHRAAAPSPALRRGCSGCSRCSRSRSRSALFAALGGPGLGERTGPPVEELAVERTVLRPGEIELTVRNDGPDPVEIAQVAVNDGFAPFTADDGRDDRPARLDARSTVAYPWIEGEAYEVSLLTSTGGTIEHEIPVAAETPEADAGFFGLMALLGLYVGVIPVSLGMLWLPFVRRVGAGLAAGADRVHGRPARLPRGRRDARGPRDRRRRAVGLRRRRARLPRGAGRLPRALRASTPTCASAGRARRGGGRRRLLSLALLVAIGIGLHNLGEGLAIGSAYASARSRSAPSWSSASRSTTRPRAWRSSRRSASAPRRASAASPRSG